MAGSGAVPGRLAAAGRALHPAVASRRLTPRANNIAGAASRAGRMIQTSGASITHRELAEKAGQSHGAIASSNCHPLAPDAMTTRAASAVGSAAMPKTSAEAALLPDMMASAG